MKRIYISLLTSLFSVMVFAAALTIKPACNVGLYQPEVPKALRK